MNAAARQAPRHPLRVAFALGAAPLAWAAQGLLGWYLSSRGCPAPEHEGGALRAVQVVANIAFVLLALLALLAGMQRWRALRADERADRVPHDRAAFLAAATVLVSAVFLLAVAWASIAPFVLPRCVSGR
jgi:hypothetical protein